jgi:hypothetical protein
LGVSSACSAVSISARRAASLQARHRRRAAHRLLNSTDGFRLLSGRFSSSRKDIPRSCTDSRDQPTWYGFKEGKYEKAFVSAIYTVERALFDVPVKDLNSVKAYRREIMDGLPVRPDWHRFMIVIAAEQGFTVTEIPVPLYPRHAGKSKFGLSRIPIGVLDMLSVWFELKFGKKPLLLFGMLGAGLFLIGFIAGIVALIVLAVTGEGFVRCGRSSRRASSSAAFFSRPGLLGEQIAGQRAELRELRRQLDEIRSTRDNDAEQ